MFLATLAEESPQARRQALVRPQAVLLPVLLVQASAHQDGVGDHIEDVHEHARDNGADDAGCDGHILGAGDEVLGIRVREVGGGRDYQPSDPSTQTRDREPADDLEGLSGALEQSEGDHLREHDLNDNLRSGAEAVRVDDHDEVYLLVDVPHQALDARDATHAGGGDAPCSGVDRSSIVATLELLVNVPDDQVHNPEDGKDERPEHQGAHVVGDADNEAHKPNRLADVLSAIDVRGEEPRLCGVAEGDLLPSNDELVDPHGDEHVAEEVRELVVLEIESPQHAARQVLRGLVSLHVAHGDDVGEAYQSQAEGCSADGEAKHGLDQEARHVDQALHRRFQGSHNELDLLLQAADKDRDEDPEQQQDKADDSVQGLVAGGGHKGRGDSDVPSGVDARGRVHVHDPVMVLELLGCALEKNAVEEEGASRQREEAGEPEAGVKQRAGGDLHQEEVQVAQDDGHERDTDKHAPSRDHLLNVVHRRIRPALNGGPQLRHHRIVARHAVPVGHWVRGIVLHQVELVRDLCRVRACDRMLGSLRHLLILVARGHCQSTVRAFRDADWELQLQV
mmetsp:Transcript_52066/g.169099  ORF Transcript_52066/g.169099 Transcript_52066/m.169099 type:complete len:565 (-) Transcript_52066:459-2153(-)